MLAASCTEGLWLASAARRPDMDPRRIPKQKNRDVITWDIESIRNRIHSGDPEYKKHDRVEDVALAWDEAHAEKQYIDSALAYIVRIGQMAYDLSQEDTSAYSWIRKLDLEKRMENLKQEVINQVSCAEEAAYGVEQAALSLHNDNS